MFILKQLRRKKNVTQKGFSDAIGVSLRTVQLYEKKGANIPMKNLVKIAQYFNTSIGQLYLQELRESGIVYDKESILSEKGHYINKLAPGKYLLSAPLITDKEEEEYAQKLDDKLFIGTLPCIGFVVEQVSVARYMAFEINNNSMNNGQMGSIPQKSVVLGKQVRISELSNKIGEKRYPHWVIVYKEGIMCKEIVSYDKKLGTLICHSLNHSPEYPDFEIKVEDIKELFAIIRKQVD